MSQEKKQVSVKAVLELLDLGKNRKEIADHFGVSQAAMKAKVWSLPELKGKKAKKQYDDEIEVVRDTEATEEVAASPETAAAPVASASESDEQNYREHVAADLHHEGEEE